MPDALQRCRRLGIVSVLVNLAGLGIWICSVIRSKRSLSRSWTYITKDVCPTNPGIESVGRTTVRRQFEIASQNLLQSCFFCLFCEIMETDMKKETVALGKLDSQSQSEPIFTGDDLRLAQLGHAQELNRQFSLLTLGALCVCLMATWEALSSVVAPALVSGGAPCLFYNL